MNLLTLLLDFPLWSEFPVLSLVYSVPNWAVNAASKGFGSDGILNAEPLPYVAHQREFPEPVPRLIIIVPNRIIKLAFLSTFKYVNLTLSEMRFPINGDMLSIYIYREFLQ